MQAEVCGFFRVIPIVVAGAVALAQEKTPDKHVQEISAEQTQDMIVASPLCQQVRKDGKKKVTVHELDPVTLEPDLSSLMQKSDDVVLVGGGTRRADVISPNGTDVVAYEDARVLRVWKGSHEVGDVITFAIPRGRVFCEAGLPTGPGPFLTAETTVRLPDFEWFPNGPVVLFLRRSQGDEAQTTPGLRLTGGGGFQGMYGIRKGSAPGEVCYKARYRGLVDDVAKCTAFVSASREPVSFCCRFDPLTKKFEGMPFHDLLKKVQAAADSLGTGQAENAK